MVEQQPIITQVNGHQVSVWDIDNGVWLAYRPWMRWCGRMLVRIDGQRSNPDLYQSLVPEETNAPTRTSRSSH